MAVLTMQARGAAAAMVDRAAAAGGAAGETLGAVEAVLAEHAAGVKEF